MREISTQSTDRTGSNPSLSSPPNPPQRLENEGAQAPENTLNSHVTHTAAVPGDALPPGATAFEQALAGYGIRRDPDASTDDCTVYELPEGVSAVDVLRDLAARREPGYAVGAVEPPAAHPAVAAPEGAHPSGDPVYLDSDGRVAAALRAAGHVEESAREGLSVFRLPGDPAAAGPFADPDPGDVSDPRRPLRHCAESWDDADGNTRNCDSLVSDGLQCTVCSSAKCYAHCGSVDHFEGAELQDEGARVPFTWKAVRVGGTYHGHVAIPGLVIMKTSSVTRDQVMTELARAMRTPRPPEPRPAPAAPPLADDGRRVEVDVDLDHPGFKRRHAPLMEAAAGAAMDVLAELDPLTLDALTVICIGDPEGERRQLARVFRLGEPGGVYRQRLFEGAARTVREAMACGCEECAPLRGFAHLIGRGGQ